MLARPGTRRPSILHESASKPASRALRHTPGLEIVARIHLAGSRGLERLPGTLFCSRVHVVFPLKIRHFWRKKAPLRGTHLPSSRVFGQGRVFPGKKGPCEERTCRQGEFGGPRTQKSRISVSLSLIHI